jgi:hypothetical protein
MFTFVANNNSRMKSKVFILLAIMIGMFSCKNETSDKVELLKTEVIGIHDEVMPKMTDIHKNKKLLREALNVVSEGNNKDVILLHIKKLEEADEAMMAWMGEYKIPTGEQEAITYLQGQKVEIERVKKMMLLSIEKSNEIIKQYEVVQ